MTCFHNMLIKMHDICIDIYFLISDIAQEDWERVLEEEDCCCVHKSYVCKNAISVSIIVDCDGQDLVAPPWEQTGKEVMIVAIVVTIVIWQAQLQLIYHQHDAADPRLHCYVSVLLQQCCNDIVEHNKTLLHGALAVEGDSFNNMLVLLEAGESPDGIEQDMHCRPTDFAVCQHVPNGLKVLCCAASQ